MAPSVQREDILARVSDAQGVEAFLSACGLAPRPLRHGEIKISCPFHADSKPSLGFFEKSGGWCWHCFPCAVGGDVIEFGAKLWGIDSKSRFGELMEEFGRVLGVLPSGGEGGGISAARAEELKREREAKAARNRAVAEAKRAEEVKKARSLWDEAREHAKTTAGREAVRNYVRSRGVDTDLLDRVYPLWSSYWRWHPRVYRKYYEEDGAGGFRAVTEHVPALVLGCVNPTYRSERGGGGAAVCAVQRVYLDEESGGKIKYGLDEDGGGVLAKATLGTKCGDRGGVTCRMTGPCESGELLLCEGPDSTAPALLMAMCEGGSLAGAVWACVDVNGLKAFRLGPDDAKWVRSVRVCGDFDLKGAGQRGAAACASNLLRQVASDEWKAWGGADVSVRVCLPDETVCPELVEAMRS